MPNHYLAFNDLGAEVGEGPCTVQERIIGENRTILRRFHPGKLSLFGQMTLHQHAPIREGKDLLVASLVGRIKQLFIDILESSYRNNSYLDKEYYITLLDKSEFIEEFLEGKIGWLYKRIKSKMETCEGYVPRTIRGAFFHKYLIGELVKMIQYFEEYIFLREHSDQENFGTVIAKYKPILLWGVKRFSTVAKRSEQDDLFQEFCLVLWNCLNEWNGCPDSSQEGAIGFTSYFKKSLRNKATDIWRRDEDTDKRKIQTRIAGTLDERNEGNFMSRQVSRQIARGWIRANRLLLHSNLPDIIEL